MEKSDRVRLGTRIRKIRDERQLSQGALGRLIGAEQREISAYETGRSLPRVDRFMEIARALDVTAEDLFAFGAQVPHPKHLSPTAIRVGLLVDQQADRDPDFPATALRVLRALAKK
jgi:transcriptional regulator with XRE-family HTH domain